MTTRSSRAAPGGRELLARLSGMPEERLRSEPAAVVRAFGVLGMEALALVRGYASEDPATREAASRRWAELNAMLPKPDPHVPPRSPGLSEPERERLHSALAAVVEALRQVEDDVTTNGRDEAPHIRDRSKP